ncbi:1676_t:CDS:2 [Cetraspora pellucida]|uniref:1676_t:CDS:1 n=1 Tax=Cetraspora pellucida TaxID=1433469 RepID=A0A9N9H476_9GLOM|nr:1676_t:CDS:2 [Cetraspora pellucida]
MLLPPEILQAIFEELDEPSLYSSVLVSRDWCQSAISILWANPLEFAYNNRNQVYYDKIASILSTYISSLPNESRQKLIDAYIARPVDFSNISLMFNYPQFLQNLNYILLQDSIEKILDRQHDGHENDRIKLVSDELLKMFLNQDSHLKSLDFSYQKLSGIIISHLDKRIIDFPLEINLANLPSIITGLSRLQKFSCKGTTPSRFLSSLAAVTLELQSLNIYDGEDSHGMINLINAQKTLKEIDIHICRDIPRIISVLNNKAKTFQKFALSARNAYISIGLPSLSDCLEILCNSPDLEELTLIFPRGALAQAQWLIRRHAAQMRLRLQQQQARTLQFLNQTIRAHRQNFPHQRTASHQRRNRTTAQIPQGHTQNPVLITSPRPLPIRTTQNQPTNRQLNSFATQPPRQILFTNSGPQKLRKLLITYHLPHYIQSFVSLIQNTKGSLEVIKLDISNALDQTYYTTLFSSIVNNCPNLTFIHLYIPNESLLELSQLFRNCLKLEDIHLFGDQNNSIDISPFLEEMSPIVPTGLRKLEFGISWNYSVDAIKSFLGACMNRLKFKPCKFYHGDLSDEIDGLIQFYHLTGVIQPERRFY